MALATNHVLKNIRKCLQPGGKVLDNISIWIQGDRIHAVESWERIQSDIEQSGNPYTVRDCSAWIAAPGLIDCHTHLLFAGSREGELYARARGTPYLEILRQGGGIYRTVEAVRSASEEELIENGRYYLDMALSYGITTVEIKTGYGLDYSTEEKMLRVINRLNAHPVDIVPTFLVHTVPRGLDRKAYIEEIAAKWIPSFRDRAEWFDLFLEEGVFSLKEAEFLSTHARDAGYHLGLHTNQVHDIGGIGLADTLGMRHVDHLEVLSDEDAHRIRRNPECYAVFLPAAEAFVFSDRIGQIEKLLDIPDRLVLSSDFNPGSSPVLSPYFIMAHAVLRYRLHDPFLILDAYTVNPATMLYLDDRGVLAPGKKADMVFMQLDAFEQIPYWAGTDFVQGVMKSGSWVEC